MDKLALSEPCVSRFLRCLRLPAFRPHNVTAEWVRRALLFVAASSSSYTAIAVCLPFRLVVNIWVVSSLWLLQIRLLWVFMLKKKIKKPISLPKIENSMINEESQIWVTQRRSSKHDSIRRSLDTLPSKIDKNHFKTTIKVYGDGSKGIHNIKKHLSKKSCWKVARTDRFHSTWTGTHSFPLPPSSAKQRLFQTAIAKNTGLPLSLTPSWRAFFREKAGLHHLSSCPLLPIIETKSQMSMAQRWGLPPFCSAPTRGWRLYIKCGENTGAWSPWPSSITIVVWSHEDLRVLSY